MPLKKYQKTTKYTSSGKGNNSDADHFVMTRDSYNTYDGERFTMWDFFSGIYYLFKKAVASSSAAGMILPILFITIGVGFIGSQILPKQLEDIRAANNYYDRGSTPLVDFGYIEQKEQYISNPGADYFKQLSESARAASGGFFQDQAALDYEGTLYLTIDKLGIDRMPVKANVDSGNEAVYNSVLDTNLAHFRGSSLPFSELAGNTVIYGHSVGGSYNPDPNDPISSFTFLSELQVGDTIKIEQDGEIYEYRMTRSKRVKPEDTSILIGNPGQESLTLFTCWGYPNGGPGNRSGRLVVTAMPA